MSGRLVPLNPPLVLPDDLPADAAARPVCGVVAVAVAAGVPFALAWWHLAQLKGPCWHGSTHAADRCAALYALGVRWKTFHLRRRTTLWVWARCITKPGNTCMVSVRGHVMLVQDGQVLDQEGVVPVDLHSERNCIVHEVMYLKERIR